MITLIIIVLLSILLYLKPKILKAYKTYIYTVAILLSALSLIIPKFVLFMPFIKGFLGLAIFYLVIIAGALPNVQVKRKLMMNRAELSIIGFITITPHAIFNFLKILNGEIDFAYFGFIAYVIMIPLFITSFISIRKKMNNKDWKNLQRFAYIVYILLFIHLIIHFSLPINKILYILLLTVYIIFKSIKIFKLFKKSKLAKA